MPEMNWRKQEYVFNKLWTSDRMEVLIETNPELLCHFVLVSLNNDVGRDGKIERIAKEFLKRFSELLKFVGIGCLEFNTIINAISIAYQIEAKWFLYEIRRLLQYQIFGRAPKFFVYIMYSYPRFVSDLITIMPEIFDEVILSQFEHRYIEKEFRHINSEKWLEYVRLFRCLYQLFNERGYEMDNMPRELDMLSQMIFEGNRFGKIDFAQLTINQIEDLMWYADFMHEDIVLAGIKDALQQLMQIKG